MVNGKKNVKLWPSGFTVLFAHIGPAIVNGKGHAGKCLHNIGWQHPVFRVFRVVVITVHRQAVAAYEVIAVSIVVFVLCAHIVSTDRSG
ncbi:hypothetical protein SDC9_88776 [bioreactor metagenome]|uniref:Uncharacterized protein n=1 Tax=bioreactor metagenome TaxID=1076179 RepID=A0A644ZX12_9ZZZZ